MAGDDTDKWDFFLVHAGKAKESARELYGLLDGVEGATVFLDENLELGSSWADGLARALQNSRIAVVMITPPIAEAWYAHEEILRVIDHYRRHGSPLLVPIYLDGTFPGENSPYGLYLVQSIVLAEGKTLAAAADDLLDRRRELPPEVDDNSEPQPAQSGDRTALVVDAHGGGDYATISRALERSDPWMTIRVRPGLYEESLVISQPVHIVGEGRPDEIVIQAFNATTVTMNAVGGSIEGVTVQQMGGSFPYQAVDVANGTPEIKRCLLNGGTRSAIRVRGTAMPKIRRNVVGGTAEIGIEVGDCASAAIRQNWVKEMTSTAVWLGGQAHAELDSNEIRNAHHIGIHACEDAEVQIVSNSLVSCHTGIQLEDRAYASIRANTIEKTRASGILIHGDADGEVFGNTIRGCGEAQIHVFTTGDPHIEANTIEDGRADGICVELTGDRGVTITQNHILDNQWSGVLATDSTTAAVRENLIGGNHDNGITLKEGSIAQVQGNVIKDNGQNGVSAQYGTVELYRNDIVDNGRSGVFLAGCDARCDRNRVAGSEWSAVTVLQGSPRLVENDLSCAADAAVVVDGAQATVRSNRLHSSGVALEIRSGSVEFDFNTVDANRLAVKLHDGASLVDRRNNRYGGNDAMVVAPAGLEPESLPSADEQDLLKDVGERTPVFLTRLENLDPSMWGARGETGARESPLTGAIAPDEVDIREPRGTSSLI